MDAQDYVATSARVNGVGITTVRKPSNYLYDQENTCISRPLRHRHSDDHRGRGTYQGSGSSHTKRSHIRLVYLVGDVIAILGKVSIDFQLNRKENRLLIAEVNKILDRIGHTILIYLYG
jgi:hypothetical protein